MSEKDPETIGEGKYLRLLKTGTWEYAQRVNSEGIVVLVAVTDAGKLLLVEQYRPAVGRRVLELPAGLSGDDAAKRGEALETAAQRELEEETGYVADAISYLIEGPVSAGMSTEEITFFRCEGLRKVGPGGGDESEDIVVHEVTLGEVEVWIRDRVRTTGCAVDPKVFAGLYFAGAARSP